MFIYSYRLYTGIFRDTFRDKSPMSPGLSPEAMWFCRHGGPSSLFAYRGAVTVHIASGEEGWGKAFRLQYCIASGENGPPADVFNKSNVFSQQAKYGSGPDPLMNYSSPQIS